MTLAASVFIRVLIDRKKLVSNHQTFSPGVMASTCANPLLLDWIKEIYDLAKERNSKGITTYKKAYESMKACPLTFSHPSEAQQLDGIGPKICDRLTEKLKAHCEANGLPSPKKPRGKGETPLIYAFARATTDSICSTQASQH